jgi:hypothetical protein
VVLATVLASQALPQEPPLVTLKSIHHETSDGSSQLVVEADGPLRYDYRSPDATRVRLTLMGADAAGLPERIDVGSSEIREVRVTGVTDANGSPAVQLEVDLQGPMYHQVFTRDETLVLVFRQPPIPRTAAGSERGTTPLASQPTLETEPESPPATPAAATPATDSESPSDTPPPLGEPTPPPTNSATRILDVAVDRNDGSLAVRVEADGRLRYEDFYVEDPVRLVVDLEGVVFEPAARRLAVDVGPVRCVRVAQHRIEPQPVVRLVIDLDNQLAYQMLEGSQTLTVLLEMPASHPG